MSYVQDQAGIFNSFNEADKKEFLNSIQPPKAEYIKTLESYNAQCEKNS